MPVALVPASAAPFTAPWAAPAAAPTTTDFKTFFTFFRMSPDEALSADSFSARFLVMFLREDEDLLDVGFVDADFLAAFFPADFFVFLAATIYSFG